MRKLFGFACHLASVRLHEAAVGMTGIRRNDPPRLWIRHGDNVFCGEATLPDVAPRLAAAVEAIGDRVQHATWLASIVGLERITRNR